MMGLNNCKCYRERRSRSGITTVEILVCLLIIGLLACLIYPALSGIREKSRQSTCISNLRNLSLAMQQYITDSDGTYPPPVQATFVKEVAIGTLTWRQLICPYMAEKTFPKCPDAIPTGRFRKYMFRMDNCGYAYNDYLSNVHQPPRGAAADIELPNGGAPEAILAQTASTVVLFDARIGVLTLAQPDDVKDFAAKKTWRGVTATGAVPELNMEVPGALRHSGGANYTFADGHVSWLRPAQVHLGKRPDGSKPSFRL